MITLMYITNKPNIAKIAENSGVDRIWIDLEVNGKEERQKNMNTVKSKHKIEDISKVKSVLRNSELIVRVNPIYSDSRREIDEVIKQGADIVMLPFFKTLDEVTTFIKLVNKRARVCLLCETPEAVSCIDSILNLEGIDEIHIGLNDLHLGYKKKFMFELLSDGTVDYLCEKFAKKGIKYGFGGIARVGEGTLPAEKIIIEHYRLGSSIAILSRSFCNTDIIEDEDEIESIFKKGLKDIREVELLAQNYDNEKFNENKNYIKQKVNEIVEKMN